jgi:hypothetical protein
VRETGVAGVGEALGVVMADRPHAWVVQALEEVGGVVGGPVVHHDDVGHGPDLLQDARERPLQERSAVVGRDHHGDGRDRPGDPLCNVAPQAAR